MSCIVFGLVLTMSFFVYSVAVVRTKYDRDVDDERQEEFIKRYRG